MTASDAPARPAGKAVYVHVGAPKTGTTFLQNVLWKNRTALAEDSVCYPLERPGEHLIASLDLQEMSWGGRRDQAWEGAWERVASRVREWPGRVAVVSNELLGGATPEHARRAVESLQPADVHVVFTARDLARQLVSDWQEQVKHMHTVSSTRFIDDLVTYEIDAPEPFGFMFWGLHDAVRVLRSWSAAVPPERIHVVTVPQPGGPVGRLWERFAELIGIDPARYDTGTAKGNTSIGLVETELVRRLNLSLGRSLGGRYDSLVRGYLSESILAARPDPVKTSLPEGYHSWALDRSKEIVAGLEAAGYDVVGDLDELVPRFQEGMSRQSHEVESPELLAAAIDAIVGLLQNPPQAAQRRAGEERAKQLERELDQRRRQPVKTVIRDLSEKHSAVMRARVLWWHTVERIRAGNRSAR